MALKDHGTFDSYKIYFVLTTWLLEYKKELWKVTAKSKKKNKTIVKDRYHRYQMKFCYHGSIFSRKFWARIHSVTVSYLIHSDSLLQNATEVYHKMCQAYYKMW